MTRQTWSALISAVLFVALAVVIALVPVPFVTWQPGRTVDVYQAGKRSVIDVAGARTYPTSGELRLTTVAQTRADSSLSLPEGVIAFVLPHRDTLPRAIIHPPGQTPEEAEAADVELMDTSQQDAVVAALREAGIPITERPVIESVNIGGPADGYLIPGDLIVTVNGGPVSTPEEAEAAIARVKVGDRVTFHVIRNGMGHNAAVTTTASNSDPTIPVIGVGIGVGYDHLPKISITIDSRIGGSSAGLIFALGIYDTLTPGDLLNGQLVAGTGTISPDGQVGPIGGVHEKIRAAEEAGVTLFLIPADNCDDLSHLHSNLQLARVATLGEAVEAVRAYGKSGPAADLPTCER